MFVLRLRQKAGPGRRLRAHHRGHGGDGEGGDARGAHRGRPSPRVAVRVLRADDPGHPRRPPGDANQGVHRGRDRLLLAALEDRAEGRADAAQGGRPAVDARWGRRDLLAAPGQAAQVHRQGRSRPLVRDPRHRSLARHPHQRHHALRPRRDARRARRPLDPPARAAGRLRRLPDVHPPHLPGGGNAAGPAPHAAGRQPADDRHLAPAARQLPAHRGVLGGARGGDGLDCTALRRRRRQRHAGGRAHPASVGRSDARGPWRHSIQHGQSGTRCSTVSGSIATRGATC
jgi:hypothetical protein